MTSGWTVVNDGPGIGLLVLLATREAMRGYMFVHMPSSAQYSSLLPMQCQTRRGRATGVLSPSSVYKQNDATYITKQVEFEELVDLEMDSERVYLETSYGKVQRS